MRNAMQVDDSIDPKFLEFAGPPGIPNETVRAGRSYPGVPWQRLGPWDLVLTDYRFFPGTKIRDGAQTSGRDPRDQPTPDNGDHDRRFPRSPEEPTQGIAEAADLAEAFQSGANATGATGAGAAVLIGVVFLGIGVNRSAPKCGSHFSALLRLLRAAYYREVSVSLSRRCSESRK
jgi:hypothetical protein